MDTSKIHLGETMSFIMVTHRKINEGLLIRAEITQRQMPFYSPLQHELN